MRPRLQRISVVAFGLLLVNQTVQADSSTNNLSSLLQQSDVSVRRLREIDDAAAKLEQGVSPEQTILADCIHSRELKIKGLLDLTEQTQKDIQKAIRAAKPDEVTEGLDDIKTSCARAEKLLLEAEQCASNNVPQVASSKEVPSVITNTITALDLKITPHSPPPPVRHRFVERTVQTCLHQEQLATMLAHAMDLKLDSNATSDDCVAALTKLAIEPLGGWQPGKCATADSVYVACARAMNLKVKNPADPLSYGEALREEGLGVDTLLPERDPKLDSPFVLDSEVRAFLASGYAAPLPSAKRVTPD